MGMRRFIHNSQKVQITEKTLYTVRHTRNVYVNNEYIFNTVNSEDNPLYSTTDIKAISLYNLTGPVTQIRICTTCYVFPCSVNFYSHKQPRYSVGVSRIAAFVYIANNYFTNIICLTSMAR